ncbi:MAG: NADH:flavin oxidoreductase/NADH oxidase family protein [Pseudomonadota bacterium]
MLDRPVNTHTDIAVLAEPVTLPCGQVIKNRIAKAAMTEGLTDGTNQANDRLVTLYKRWGEGGAGVLVTGNVIVDRWHLERGGNLAIDGAQSNAALAGLADVAAAAKAHGSRIWAQLNHAGRQTQKMINKHPKAPSDVGLQMGNGRFGKPSPLTLGEVEDVIARFVHAAQVCEQTGFDGVQVHAAHGYLMSQFLSPLSNLRTDAFGGSLEGRAKFLLDIVRGICAAVRDDFAVTVKLNSADFQKGGFSEDDSVQVAKWLADAGCDLIEVSGGNYEQPRMINFDRKDPLAANKNKRESTKKREAYFLAFVPKLRAAIDIPIMVTGGFRSVDAMAEAVREDGVDMIGIGRPFCLNTHVANDIFDGKTDRLESRDDDLVIGSGLLGPNSPISFLRDLNAWGSLGWYYEHIYSLADGKEPDRNLSAFKALLKYDSTESKTAKALTR